MVNQSALFQIIQFVGLITPALAILIELLVGFHGGIEQLRSDRKLPPEIRVVFVGLIMILAGGVVIGIQMIMTLENQMTQIASLLIFGGLPILSLAIIIANVRISAVEIPNTGLIEGSILSLKYVLSIVIPSLLTFAIYYYPINYSKTYINSNLNWWIFREGIDPVWYFYIVAAILTLKLLYSMWEHRTIPSTEFEPVVDHWFVGTFTIGSFFLLLSVMPFFVYGWLSSNIIGIPVNSIISPTLYIWSIIVVLIILVSDLSPEEEENEGENGADDSEKDTTDPDSEET